jgi:hypothetical protein
MSPEHTQPHEIYSRTRHRGRGALELWGHFFRPRARSTVVSFLVSNEAQQNELDSVGHRSGERRRRPFTAVGTARVGDGRDRASRGQQGDPRHGHGSTGRRRGWTARVDTPGS